MKTDIQREGRRIMLKRQSSMISLLLVAALAIGTLMPIRVVSANGAAIHVDPSSMVDTDIDPGETIMFTINIADVVDLYTWQVRILFNSSVLNCSRAFYPVDHIFAGQTTSPVAPLIDNVAGSILYGNTLAGPVAGMSGNGKLCQLEFKVKTRGSSNLTFLTVGAGSTFLLDSVGDDIPYMAEGGYFNNMPPSSTDFSITASPTSLTIEQGGSDTSTITITSTNGFNQIVELTVFGAPSEVTATLNPENATPPPDESSTSTLTVSVDTTAALGTYNLTINGTSGALIHSVNITLGITGVRTTTIDVKPDTLNLKSEAQWVTVYIEVAPGYDVADINVSSIKLNNTLLVDPSAPTPIGDYDGDSIADLMVSLNRTSVSQFILSEGIMTGKVTLTMTGELDDETPFEASDAISVRMPGDLNMDGLVDMRDIAVSGLAFGSYPGRGRWNPIADENEDNIVDIRDMVLIAMRFGKTYP
jgi:hypothetical protein